MSAPDLAWDLFVGSVAAAASIVMLSAAIWSAAILAADAKNRRP